MYSFWYEIVPFMNYKTKTSEENLWSVFCLPLIMLLINWFVYIDSILQFKIITKNRNNLYVSRYKQNLFVSISQGLVSRLNVIFFRFKFSLKPFIYFHIFTIYLLNVCAHMCIVLRNSRRRLIHSYFFCCIIIISAISYGFTCWA